MEKELRLPERLALLASLVPQGSRLADVGTDHGFLPIWLRENGRIRSAVATDLRPGPLERARTHAAERNTEQLRFVLCNGLDGVAPEEADCVVIAGMGGDNIVDILSRAPWTRENTRLLLQPMTRIEVLRGSLTELGLFIQEEHLVKDSGRLYSVVVAYGGPAETYSVRELYTGRLEKLRERKLLSGRLEELERTLRPAVNGLAGTTSPEGRARREQLLSVLEECEQIRREYHA